MIIVTGSLAFDHIMDFPGRFTDHILPDKIHVISLSFEVERLEKRRGGTAGNIAYNLARLGERPKIVAAAGNDFNAYQKDLESLGIDCDGIAVFSDCPTAQLFIITDQADNQIASFFAGAMKKADQLTIRDEGEIELVHIGPDNTRAMVNHVHRCQEKGWTYIFDPGQQLIRLKPKELREGVTLAKAVVGNDYEIALLEKKIGLDRQGLAGLCEALIVTLGEKGSIVYHHGSCDLIAAVPPQKVVDPTGAGDAFRAGLIKGIVIGADWATAARLGSTVASFAVEEYGTQEHQFLTDDVTLRYQQTFGKDLDLR